MYEIKVLIRDEEGKESQGIFRDKKEIKDIVSLVTEITGKSLIGIEIKEVKDTIDNLTFTHEQDSNY